MHTEFLAVTFSSYQSNYVLHGFRVTRTAESSQSASAGLRTPFPATVVGQAVVMM